MPRYIDAQKLKDAMNIEDDANGNFNIMTALRCVDDAPTADVQEVRHGHWIKNSLDNFRKVECSCSICGWSGVDNYDSYVDINDFEYCPYCGAKMDEEEQE